VHQSHAKPLPQNNIIDPTHNEPPLQHFQSRVVSEAEPTCGERSRTTSQAKKEREEAEKSVQANNVTLSPRFPSEKCKGI
jgi:hypothetical protein